MSRHLAEKLDDLARCFRPASFETVEHHYDEAYAGRMDSFARRPRSRDELELLIRTRQFALTDRVLDLGCNTGQLTETLHQATGCRVEGIDRNRAAIEWAAESFPARRFYLYDGLGLPLPDDSYEHVMINHVLGHVADPELTLADCRRVLTPSGTLSVVTPNRWYKCGMTLPNLGNDYEPDPTVLRYYTRRSLARLVRRSGFDIRECRTTGDASWPFGPDGPESLRMRVFLLARARS